MNKKQRQFIAGELVKVAKDLTASGEIPMYKTTFPVTYISDEEFDDRSLDSVLYGYGDAVENYLSKDYNVYVKWQGRPKVEERWNNKYSDEEYILNGNVEFTFTLNRISDTDLDRFIERGIRQG
jgi:hypothetical protein